jgi:hypothetical protein
MRAGACTSLHTRILSRRRSRSWRAGAFFGAESLGQLVPESSRKELVVILFVAFLVVIVVIASLTAVAAKTYF